MIRRFSPLVFFFAAALASSLVLGGCSSPEDATCSDRCDCEGCSSHDYDSCLADFDAQASQADRLGCTDLYDDYVGCLADTGVCRGTEYDTSCGPEHDRLKSCIGGTTSVGTGPGKK